MRSDTIVLCTKRVVLTLFAVNCIIGMAALAVEWSRPDPEDLITVLPTPRLERTCP